MRPLFHQFGAIHEQLMMQSLTSFLRDALIFQWVVSVLTSEDNSLAKP